MLYLLSLTNLIWSDLFCFDNDKRKCDHAKRTSTRLYHRGSYLVVCTDGPQLHDELEAEEVVGPDGLELQETAESHQLRSGQVV